MDGQQELSITQRIEGKVGELDQSLNIFEQKTGVRAVANKLSQDEFNRIMEFTPEDFRKLTPEQCAEYALILSQFSFYLQRAVNKESAVILWAEESIKRIIADKMGQYKGLYEEKKMLAIKQDSAAQEYQKIAVQKRLRVSKLEYMATRIKEYSDKFTEMQRVLTRKRYE